jgi:surface protein
MSNLFKSFTTFNEDISGWDVRNVTDMKGMFSNAINFNKPEDGMLVKYAIWKACSFMRTVSISILAIGM